MKYYNPSITPQLFYIQALFINIGVPLGNFAVAKCLPVLGIRYTMRLSSLIVVVRMANFMYLGTNLKNILFTVIDDDLFVTNISVVTLALSVLANLYAGRLWQSLGPIPVYALSILSNIACDLLIIFFNKSLLALIIAVLIFRPVSSASFIFNYMTPYTFYPKQVALLLLKFYDSMLFMAFLVGVVLNFTVRHGDYRYAFAGFLVVDCAGLYATLGYLKNAYTLIPGN